MSCDATTTWTRRRAIWRAGLGAVGFAGMVFAAPPAASAGEADEDAKLLERLTGKVATPSERVRLRMPPAFGNGYTVPLTLEVESAMSEGEHVRTVHVLAPKNPIILVASFHFTPASGRASVSTRIRLAEPQNVLAAAEMSDGTWLMAKTWVKVDTNGCA